MWRDGFSSTTSWKRKWSDYQNGFQLTNTDIWVGLERIYQLTSANSYRLRIEMYIPSTGENWRSVEYWQFSVSSQSQLYTLSIDG